MEFNLLHSGADNTSGKYNRDDNLYMEEKMMITEQELKDRCTPDFIKWICELAEGFEFEGKLCYRYGEYVINTLDKVYFPFLIHRAVEGWNTLSLKNRTYYYICIDYVEIIVQNINDSKFTHYVFTNYQPQSLTHAECAMLHCLLDVLKLRG